MKISCGLGELKHDSALTAWDGLFSAKLDVDFVCFQDLYHIISKMRTRLLETSSPMKIGKYKISLTTLRVSFASNSLQ